MDTGDIWKKVTIKLNGLELFDEINNLLFEAELALIEWACENYKTCSPRKQKQCITNYRRRRVPDDSELDINESIASQFNLLRVCDPDRFPAYFYKGGQKFNVRIEKDEK